MDKTILWCIKAQCKRCRGGGIPYRINDEDYISHFGEVKEGEWVHESQAESDVWACTLSCDAQKIWEALHQKGCEIPEPAKYRWS